MQTFYCEELLYVFIAVSVIVFHISFKLMFKKEPPEETIEEIGDTRYRACHKLNVFAICPVLLTFSLQGFSMVLQMFAAHFCKVT